MSPTERTILLETIEYLKNQGEMMKKATLERVLLELTNNNETKKEGNDDKHSDKTNKFFSPKRG